jgi:hypothetical protein
MQLYFETKFYKKSLKNRLAWRNLWMANGLVYHTTLNDTFKPRQNKFYHKVQV